jgi:hypothetical protein
MLNERENILSALREKPLKVYEIMKRANISNEEACQSLLLKMRDDGLVKFDIHKDDGSSDEPAAITKMAQGTYCGLSPSASNCRLHSVGGSRSRSTPMPRGRRPSTAALTRLGARKASEIVILTWRTLHFSRTQISWTVVTRPETTSSSHWRPLAMALTRRARRSNCSGWTSLRDA